MRLLLLAILFPTIGLAQKTVPLDHKNDPNKATYSIIELKHNETLKIIISETEPDNFDYTINGLESINKSINKNASNNNTWEFPERKHDRKYGGYLVTASLKEGKESSLSSKTWFIPVKTPAWNIDFAGGFQVSENTSPVFGLKSQTNSSGEEEMVVFRNNDAEDEAKYGAVASAHFYHDRNESFAWTLSLGVDQNDTNLSFGPSYRFGSRGAVSLQANWSQIDRLPSGVILGDVVTDANILNDLPSKVDLGVALTFSLKIGSVNLGEIFQKPFTPPTTQ